MLKRACAQVRTKGEVVVDDSNGKFLGDMLPEMATFSTFIALFGCLCKDGRVIRDRGALAGFTPIVWSVVALPATGGLCAAAVIAYADNLLKGFATGGSMLLSTFISWLWLGFEITPGFALGASMVLGSMWVYACAEA